MVVFICNPRAATVRCERESHRAPTPVLLVSTAVNKRPWLTQGGGQGPTPMLSSDHPPLHVHEVGHMCSPKHCVQRERERGGQKGRTQQSDRWVDTEHENETFLRNRDWGIVLALSARHNQTLSYLWGGRAKPEGRLMEAGEGCCS